MPYKNIDKQREYQRRWREARRATFFRSKNCVKCGSTDNLELDHIDRSQKIDHNIWSWSEARRQAELAKCQILCRSCHWQKTYKDMNYGHYTHGTTTMYRKGCKCDRCKLAKKLSR